VGLNERANRAPDGQLERRMFVVLDEAGNQRLEDLPSTPPPSPGSGATGDHLAVRAQITKAYGPAAGIVLANHLSTVFDAGLSDQDSLSYVAKVVGDEEVEARQLSGRAATLLRNNVTDSTTRVASRKRWARMASRRSTRPCSNRHRIDTGSVGCHMHKAPSS
jgi:hypothetical protein